MINPRIDDVVEREPEAVIAEDAGRVERGVGARHAAPGGVGGEDPVDRDGDGCARGNGAAAEDIVVGEDFLGERHAATFGGTGAERSQGGGGAVRGVEGFEPGGDEEVDFALLGQGEGRGWRET